MPDDVDNSDVNAAVQDVADKARADEQAKAHDDWKQRIEQDIRELRSSQTPVVPEAPAAPVEAPAPPQAPVPDNSLATIADALEGLAEKPVEAAEDVVPMLEAPKEAVEEIVESVPRRTHGLFKPLFGRRHED